MLANAANYRFVQRFNFPARRAYNWCTDYEPADLALMKEKGQRSIQTLTSNTIILRESLDWKGKKITKVKLVRLNPNKFSWYNVHIQGPNKHSAFLYEIVPVGRKRSKLIFTGLLVVYSKTPLKRQDIKRIADRERRFDSRAWRFLAKAMKRDLS